MPLAPPVIRIVLLVSFIIRSPKRSMRPFTKLLGSSHLQWENRFSRYFSIGETDTAIIRYQASTRELADADLLASALLKSFAVIVRLTEAGTTASMKRFSRPGTILERFSRSALRPSDTHCSTLIGFIGMVRGSNPSLANTAVFVSGGGTTVT